MTEDFPTLCKHTGSNKKKKKNSNWAFPPLQHTHLSPLLCHTAYKTIKKLAKSFKYLHLPSIYLFIYFITASLKQSRQMEVKQLSTNQAESKYFRWKLISRGSYPEFPMRIVFSVAGALSSLMLSRSDRIHCSGRLMTPSSAARK